MLFIAAVLLASGDPKPEAHCINLLVPFSLGHACCPAGGGTTMWTGLPRESAGKCSGGSADSRSGVATFSEASVLIVVAPSSRGYVLLC